MPRSASVISFSLEKFPPDQITCSKLHCHKIMSKDGLEYFVEGVGVFRWCECVTCGRLGQL